MIRRLREMFRPAPALTGLVVGDDTNDRKRVEAALAKAKRVLAERERIQRVTDEADRVERLIRSRRLHP